MSFHHLPISFLLKMPNFVLIFWEFFARIIFLARILTHLKVTVMEEMRNLKMINDGPLDLSVKPWNLAKKKSLF